MSKPDGGQAFACASDNGHQTGMSLRDWFASNAPTSELKIPSLCPADVAGFLGENQPGYGIFPQGDWKSRVYAKARYSYADAMIEARSK